ncbi:hypothetical protein CVU75_00535 [Candidatus Dependentiae bacterium HGW-Dependentiae-1]|nr:MAG: hypothetical protein CVU75_00535 [Candidatus Dependentiae bacterium HGW-Dependentiae-1]
MQTQKSILMGTLFLVFATPYISGMQTLSVVAKNGLSAAQEAIMSEATQVSGGLFACLGTTFGLIGGGIYCLEEPSANPLITLRITDIF